MKTGKVVKVLVVKFALESQLSRVKVVFYGTLCNVVMTGYILKTIHTGGNGTETINSTFCIPHRVGGANTWLADITSYIL